ncbi:MAG TPA: phosphatase PAP2 family protein [Acidimicrobiales bacterium]|jgi:undecaprenyl-diphosphatase|nr:phosphatase PAP2 family protein [Acidimicrobiales bacterium]
MKLPTIPIPTAFEPFDDAVDIWFEEHVRHSRVTDLVMYSASAVGDHGVVWLALAGVQALRRRQTGQAWQRQFLRVAIGLGAESIVVNGPVKMMFRRHRPVFEGTRPLHLRTPRTSSFPSGHATAAFFGAALLREDDPIWPLYYALAVVVAASRVHVRIHHGSDVIGGVVTGIVLGELVRKLVPLESAPAPE